MQPSSVMTEWVNEQGGSLELLTDRANHRWRRKEHIAIDVSTVVPSHVARGQLARCKRVQVSSSMLDG
jgi:hypothetical protein